jgi:integrase
MKMCESHYVALSLQALEVLTEVRGLTGNSRVFPNERNPQKPMSENTMLYALYRMGYHGRATGHGFRSSASTMLNGLLGFKADVVERQLAHKEPNKVRGAYNRAEYLADRREMMQRWADYLDELAFQDAAAAKRGDIERAVA